MIKPCLLQHFLDSSAERFPEKVAIQDGAKSVTYSALQSRAKAVAVGLQTLSPARGERVGIYLDKGIDQVTAILAVLYADKAFVLMNAALHQKQLEYITRDCQITTLITSGELEKNVGGYAERLVKADEFDSMASVHADVEPVCVAITDDVSNIIYTSGSTGTPKGVVITHRNLVDTARSSTQHIGVQEDERILCMVPLNFDYGLNQLTSTLYKGCTLILYKYVLPNALLQTLVDLRITGLPALPPIWASVFNPKLARIEPDKYDLSALRYILNTGAKLPVPLVKKVRETFPAARLFLMYGFTEGFRSTFLDPSEVDRIPESIGKALPNVHLEVVNDKGEICEPEEIGELIHRGVGVTRGYWNSPELTAKVFRQSPLIPAGQYLDTVVYSGDLVKKDKDGFIYYVGRRDHQIKTGGYRVSPTEVEALVLECAGVSEVVVFGLEDPSLGQKIRALVTVSAEISSRDVIHHCKASAPYYLVPKEVFILPEFARTANGKIDRPKAVEDSKTQHGL